MALQNPYFAGYVFDQYEDKDNQFGFRLEFLPPEVVSEENVKLAALNDPEYALVIATPRGPRHVFRIDNPLDTFTSAWYFTKTAEVLPEDIRAAVAAKIVNNALLFSDDLPQFMRPLVKLAEIADRELPDGPVVYNPAFQQSKDEVNSFNKVAEAYKLAAKLTKQQRDSLPDSVFGLVIKTKSGQKIRKYPMHDENHVRAAITFFNMHYDRVPPRYRSHLARKIKQRAAQYGIQISEDNALNKFAQESLPDDFYQQIALRQKYVAPEFAEAYEKIAQVAHQYSPETVARVIEKLDHDSGFSKLYPVTGELTDNRVEESEASDNGSDDYSVDIVQLMQY